MMFNCSCESDMSTRLYKLEELYKEHLAKTHDPLSTVWYQQLCKNAVDIKNITERLNTIEKENELLKIILSSINRLDK